MTSEQASLLPGVVALNVAPPETTGRSRVNQPSKPGLWKLLAVWCRLARLWFTGSDWLIAWKLALASLVLSISTSLLLLKLSYVQNDLSSALAEKQQSDFYGAIRKFSVVAAVATPLFALTDWLDGFMMIKWRAWLTQQLLTAYYADRAYYLLQLDVPRAIDNPDQRICDDVRSFVASSVLLAVGMLRKLFFLVTFSGLLLSIAPHVFGFLLLYATAGTLVSAFIFGRPLISRTYAVLRREADLRHQLIHLREAAESVAFFKGEEREATESRNRLGLAVAAGLRRLALEAGLGVWLNVYSNLTLVVPSLLMAPRYFAGEVRFGEISQVAFTFQRIEAAISYLVTNLAELSALAAQTERLDELLKALRHGSSSAHQSPAKAGGGIVRRTSSSPDTMLDLTELCFAAPRGGPLLATDLSLTLRAGQSLLIVGPSGCGKSSLLRCIAGLWTHGSGSIITPPASTLFFLPQKPFMCLGTLGDQLCFPHTRQPGTDAELAACLAAARLPDLIERVGGLNADADWALELSTGEQQRVAFARLFHQNPTLAFLDESTSGLDPGTEAAMYAELRRRGTACVSVGHRPQLVQWHTHVLECMGGARWVFSTGEEYLRRQANGAGPQALGAATLSSGSLGATEVVLLRQDSFQERLTPRRSTVL